MGVTHYDGTYEEEIKHHSSYALPKDSLRQEELIQALRQGEVDARRAVAHVFEKIPESVFDLNKPIVIASKEKEHTGGGWESTVGPGVLLDFPSHQIGLVDMEGNEIPATNGHTFLVLKPQKDTKFVGMVEIEIPREGAFVQKEMLFQNPIENVDQVKTILEKYNLSAS